MSGCGPDGLQLSPQLATMANTNAAFSQLQWEIAKQDGCLPCAAQAFPQWPPRNETAFTYPMLQSTEEVAGLDTARYGTPFNPSAAEIQGADPATLPCAVPADLRGLSSLPSAFTPSGSTSQKEIGSAAQPFVIPDPDPLDQSMRDDSKPYIEPTNVDVNVKEKIEQGSATDILDSIQGVWHDIIHWNDVPGDDAVQKIVNMFTRNDRLRALLLLLLFIGAMTAILSCTL